MSEQMAAMLHTPFVVLFNHLWQSTLFAAAILALTLLLRRNSARVRHLLWLAASVKFLVPFALVAAAAALIPWHPVIGEPGDAPPRLLSVAGDLAAPMSVDMVYPQPVAGGVVDQGVSIWPWLMLVGLAVWVLGVTFVAGRWLVRWREIRRALRASELMAGIDFPAPVRMTDRQLEPGIVGIVRPVLLLPRGIEERLTLEQMRAVLAHERCHLRWRDNLTAALHMWVETLFWFFPPVWWIGARLIEERERDCDEQVVRDGHAPRSYAEGILAVCEHYIASRLPCVSGVSGADLRQRVESIVKNALVLKLDRPRKFALAAIACCAMAVPIGAGMLSGNAWQMLLSSPYSAATIGYWEVGIAMDEHLNRVRTGNPRALTCPAPDAEFIDRRNALAATVARLAPDDGDKVLLFAVAANSTRDVRRLLAGGVGRDGDGFMHSGSLMGIAAQFADVPMLELLVEAGFSVDEPGFGGIGNNGNTPLMVAISRGRLENADWLIRSGADVNAEDRNGWSALVLAMISCSDQELVDRLIHAGAVPNERALRIANGIGMILGAVPATVAATAQGTASAPAAPAPDSESMPPTTGTGSNPDVAPDMIVPNGMPILDAWSVQLPEDGQLLVMQPPSEQPLWAPSSFGTLPPPLTDEELRRQWPGPSTAELEADAWRLESPTRFAEVTTDIDGDGSPDRAVLRVDATGWKESLFVQLSSVLPDSWQPLFSVPHDRQSPRLVMGVSPADPGTHVTACGKGYGRCGPDEPREVVLKYPGITYFTYESAASLVFWDESSRQLRRVWISD